MGDGLIAAFARNPVAANLLMLTIIVSGLASLGVVTARAVRLEVFPEIPANTVTVTVAYPGASPAEVEEAVCARIEEQIQGLTGVRRVLSTAAEGAGTVAVEALHGADLQRLLNDVKSRLDAIDTFPEDAEKPVVQEVVLRHQVVSVAVSGDVDERTLRRAAEQVRDEITALPGITLAELGAVRPYEIAVEVPEERLSAHGLRFDDVAAAVRASSLSLPGGLIRDEGGEILLRTEGQAYTGGDFADLVLMAAPDGTRVTLGEVADVVDGFQETDQASRFDGRPAALVKVFRVGNQSALDVSAAVHRYVQEARGRMPEGVHLTTWRDEARVLRSRMELLLRNAAMGFVLVFLLLALFLRFKVAVWVCAGLPVSFLGAAALMPVFDVSLNMISLFAFLVVLGIVVDDAIVVGENVHKHQKAGEEPLGAAIRGSREVAVAVTFAVLTTVAAFTPMFHVTGNLAGIWRVIPLVVIPALLFSLVETKLILPAHLGHMKPEPERPAWWARPWLVVQGACSRGLQWVAQRLYRPSLELGLRLRYLTLSAFLALMVVTAAWVASGRMKFLFFPEVEGDNVVASVTMPVGTPTWRTALAVERIERAALELDAELGRGSVIQHVLASVGDQPFLAEGTRAGGQAGRSLEAGHRGEVNLQLLPAEERTMSAEEVLRLWRRRAGAVEGAREVTFTSALFSAGDDVDVELSAADLGVLQEAARALREQLARYEGVHGIADTFQEGKRELRLDILPRAETLGLTRADLARQVRQAFHGEEAQRVQRRRDDVRVMVRYPHRDRITPASLDGMTIRTREGSEVPFWYVASAVEGRGDSVITRTDRRRTVRVTAAVDKQLANPGEIAGDLAAGFLPELSARYTGLGFAFEGEQRNQAETLEGLTRGFLIALFLIYALMAIPLRSYLQPLLIMSAIPFGFMGAVYGHVLLGMELSIMSMFGLVALAGVAVNGSLVLVDFVNRRRAAGAALLAAAREAGVARFRPIVLTALTTSAGLTPLMLEKSMQARFLIPMAASLAFGVLFAVFVTLLLVPCLYLVLEDLRGLGRRLLPGAHPPQVEAPGPPRHP